jgi:hypothetical protein
MQRTIHTGGDESRHDHRWRPVTVERPDVRRGSARVRARHGCAGDDVVLNLPRVVGNACRRRQQRPRGYDVNPRCRQIRLHYWFETVLTTRDICNDGRQAGTHSPSRLEG